MQYHVASIIIVLLNEETQFCNNFTYFWFTEKYKMDCISIDFFTEGTFSCLFILEILSF